MIHRSYMTIQNCPPELSYLTGPGPIGTTAPEAIALARGQLPNYDTERQIIRWKGVEYPCEITTTQEDDSTIPVRDGVARLGQTVYAVPDWFDLDATGNAPVRTGVVTCLPFLSFEANSVDWGEGPGRHDLSYTSLQTAQREANAERQRRREIRDRRHTERERQLAIAREADVLRDAARTFCLTPDGQQCRPDIWRRLHGVALRWIGQESSESLPPLMKTALAIVPVGSTDGFVLAVARELAEWAVCVADAIQDPMSDD